MSESSQVFVAKIGFLTLIEARSNISPMKIVIALLLAGSSLAWAKDNPLAVYDAKANTDPAAQGWIDTHDKEHAAEATVANGILRITDDDADGLEGRYFRKELADEQRAAARESGFVYKWRLRIPEATGGVTRAIGAEVCVSGAEGANRLRMGLQFGRRGGDLLAGLHAGSDGWVEDSLAVANSGDFHDWTLVFDGKSAVLNVFVDQQLLLAARVDNRDKGHDLVFGSRASGTGVSEWESVRFSLGTETWKLTTPAPSPEKIDVFTGGEDGYFSYRIPSLVVAPNGDLLVFCEGRKSNLSDDGDIDLLQKRSTDGGATWRPQDLIYEEGGDAHIKFGNPTAVVDEKTGVIWLAVNRDYLTESGARAGGNLSLFRSGDSGASWSDPIDITASIKQPDWGHYAFGPGAGVQLKHGPKKGRLLIPANFRRSFSKSQPSFSHVIFSDDHGQTWKLGGVLGDFTNECQIVEIIEGGKPGLLINMRNHWGRGGFPDKSGSRLVARSFDAGETWDAETMDFVLTEPPCQASLYRYSFAENGEKSRILFANPAGSGRSNLKIRLSYDEGRTWPVSKLVAPGSAAYSCMARLPDGRLGVIFERNNYGKLSFAAVALDWLEP